MNEKPEVAKVGLHELKPCPFCGGTPEKEIADYGEGKFIAAVRCSECGARIFRKDAIEAAPKAVAEAWNKRADDWTLPAMEPPRKREITINVQVNGKEVWRGALFVGGTPHEPSVTPREYAKDAVQKGFSDMQKRINQAVAAVEPWTPDKRMTELEKASELLREYLKAHGDPHTSVIVTQVGATVKQGERGVKFDNEMTLAQCLKNAYDSLKVEPQSQKHGTWQETLLRILDTHMSRRNSPNVPLQVTLPSEVVVSLRNWLLGNAS